jgi:hypothetical protein
MDLIISSTQPKIPPPFFCNFIYTLSETNLPRVHYIVYIKLIM